MAHTRSNSWIRRIRPAPLASAVAKLTGMSTRRVVEVPRGRFFINPVSRLGVDLLSGEYEASMCAVLEGDLKPGSTFIDLGANEGFFTVVASKLVGPTGSVVAVEPQSRLQTVVLTNAYLNGCCNVRLIRTAVSGTNGEVEMQITSELNTGGTSLFRSAKYRQKTERVRSVRLQQFLEQTNVTRCDLMKVDVEGAEYDIFMNAREVLRSGVLRNIAIEYHNSIMEKQGLSPDELHRTITGCGYTLDDSGGNWVYRFNG